MRIRQGNNLRWKCYYCCDSGFILVVKGLQRCICIDDIDHVDSVPDVFGNPDKII